MGAFERLGSKGGLKGDEFRVEELVTSGYWLRPCFLEQFRIGGFQLCQ